MAAAVCCAAAGGARDESCENYESYEIGEMIGAPIAIITPAAHLYPFIKKQAYLSGKSLHRANLPFGYGTGQLRQV